VVRAFGVGSPAAHGGARGGQATELQRHLLTGLTGTLGHDHLPLLALSRDGEVPTDLHQGGASEDEGDPASRLVRGPGLADGAEVEGDAVGNREEIEP